MCIYSYVGFLHGVNVYGFIPMVLFYSYKFSSMGIQRKCVSFLFIWFLSVIIIIIIIIIIIKFEGIKVIKIFLGQNLLLVPFLI